MTKHSSKKEKFKELRQLIESKKEMCSYCSKVH